MNIWVDADACPTAIKEILFRAAERTATRMTFIANHDIPLRKSRHVGFVRVAAGFDVADDAIAERIAAGDLVVTGDIPLAAEIIGRGGLALSPRGELFTRDNISARLAMRDLMESLRSSGIESGGQAPLDQADRKAFADQLDRILAQQA